MQNLKKTMENILDFNNLEKTIEDKYLEWKFQSSLLEQYQEEYKDLQKEAEIIEKAKEIVSASAQITQDQFKKDLSDIVTMALHIVFGEEYSFKISFVQRRNTTEADLLLVEDGHEMHPLDSSGFGVADVISVALRMAYWKMQGTRNCIIWDEPSRNLHSSVLQQSLSKMIEQISQSFGLQLIVITQIKELIDIADRVFKVEKKGKISQVTRIK